MKKLLLSVVVLAVLFPFAGYAYKFPTCKMSDPKFCQCIENNCKSQFPAGRCQHDRFSPLVQSVGIERACKIQGYTTSAGLKECVGNINHYIKFCG